jgi:hypothetical protein
MNNYLKQKIIIIMIISAFILTGYGSAFGMGLYYKYVAPVKLNVSPTSYEIGQAGSFSVSGGSAPIYVYSSNPRVALVRQSSSNAGTVMASYPGTANIIARDSRGTTTTVAVTVRTKPLNTYVNPPKITVGQQAKLDVDGGTKPYRITSIDNPRIISFRQIAENTYEIVGKMPGKAHITVQDAVQQHKVAEIEVYTPPFTAAVNRNTFKAGERATATLSAGVKPYGIYGFNRNIVAVHQHTGPDAFFIIGVNPGETDVVFRDAQGQRAAVKVTVQPRFLPLQAVINPDRIPVGQAFATLTVREGVPGYVVIDQRNLTSITRVSHNEFRVFGLRQGAAGIIVRDATGKTVSVQLNILPSQKQPFIIQLTPPKDVFSVNERFNCTISGGTPNFTVSYSAPGILKETQTGINTFNFQALKKGITEIRIVDRNGMNQTKKVEVK